MLLKTYKELIVWQRSMELVKNVYQITTVLPKDELYGLTAQMRRAAISIPSNIAEGYKRKGLNEYLRFLSIAEGSAAELETQLIIVRELYPKIELSDAEAQLVEVQKMLYGLIQKLSPQTKP